VDERAARAALGIGPDVSWSEVRTAYRAAIQTVHPDRAGGSSRAAATLNEAYAVLLRSRGDGAPRDDTDVPQDGSPDGGPRRTDGRGDSPGGSAPLAQDGTVIAAGDTLVLPVPPDEAFVVVLEACHRVGDVTYVDRQCGIVEALLQIAGEGTCSLVATFQGRAHGTDAFCTLEAIEHVASPPVAAVVRELGEVVAGILYGA
jgi:hypothetical protein